MGRLLKIAPAMEPWPRIYSTSPAFADVLRLPQKQLTKVVYPLRELEQYLVADSRAGLIEQRLFDPSFEDIGRAESIFAATAGNRIEYLSSAVRLDHAPSLQQPEVRTTAPSTVVRELEFACAHFLSPNEKAFKSKRKHSVWMPHLCAVPIEDRSEPQCGCWESNSGVLEEQPRAFFIFILFYVCFACMYVCA